MTCIKRPPDNSHPLPGHATHARIGPLQLTSVLVQGTGLPYVARWLRLTVPGRVKRRTGNDLEWMDSVKSVMEEIILPSHTEVVGKKIVQIEFPKTAQILV